MKIIRVIFVLLVVSLLQSCGSAKSEAEDTAAYNKLKTLVNTKAFNFLADAAYPMQGNAVVNASTALFRGTESIGSRIFLSSNNDHITVKGDRVEASLSYFGELRTAAYADARDTGIRFSGQPLNYKVIPNDKKQNINVSYKIKAEGEQFVVHMEVYPSGNTIVFVYGSNRTGIKYTGSLEALD